MKEFLGVRGSQEERPKELEVNVDTVYIRWNIKSIKEEEFQGWKYSERQYGLREYVELIGGVSDELKDGIEELELSDQINMLALVEMYEENLVLRQENIAALMAITELYEIVMGGMI